MWNSTLTYVKKWICSSSLTNLFGSLSNSQRTWDFWSPSSIHNPPILHQVPNYTQSIMNASLAFFNDLQHSKHNKKIQFKVIYIILNTCFLMNNLNFHSEWKNHFHQQICLPNLPFCYLPWWRWWLPWSYCSPQSPTSFLWWYQMTVL